MTKFQEFDEYEDYGYMSDEINESVTFDEEVTDFQYDGCATVCDEDRSLLPEKKSQRQIAMAIPVHPTPFQLAAENSQFGTIEEMSIFYIKSLHRELKKIKIESEKRIKDLQEKEDVVQAQHEKEMKNLEKELNKQRNSKQLQKQEKKKQKKRKKLFTNIKKKKIKEDAKQAKEDEVVKSRRSTRRKEAKEKRKSEETNRTEMFSIIGTSEKDSIITIDHIDEDLEEQEVRTQEEEKEMKDVYDLQIKLARIKDEQDKLEKEAEKEARHKKIEEMTLKLKEQEEARKAKEQEDARKAKEQEDALRAIEKQKQKDKADGWKVVEKTYKKAISVLSDRKQLEHTKAKTKMCKSVITGTKCKHGEKCRFAHSIDELSISQCLFADNCRYVQKKNNKYFNIPQLRCCNHQHPGERDIDFYKRTGIEKPPSPPSFSSPVNLAICQKVPPVKIPYPPTVPPPSFTPPVKIPYPPTVPESVWKIPELPLVTSPTPVLSNPPLIRLKKPSADLRNRVRGGGLPMTPSAKTPEEIVLRVPRKLAVQAMKVAIKLGNRNIRIEIL